MHHIETVTGDGQARVKVIYTMETPGFPFIQGVLLGTVDIYDALTVAQTADLAEECIAAHDKENAAESAHMAVDLHAEGQE